MAPTLGDLPPETIQLIVSTLDLDSVRRVRLTSHALAKGSLAHFKTYLGHRNVKLTVRSLQYLVRFIGKHPFGYLVRRLSFHVPSSQAGLLANEKARSNLSHWSAQVFTAIESSTGAAKLESLSLQVTVDPDDDQSSHRDRALWVHRIEAAVLGLEIITSALHDAPMAIGKLNILGGRVEHTPLGQVQHGCSWEWPYTTTHQPFGIPCDVLGCVLKHTFMRDCLSSVTDLSITISQRMLPPRERLEPHPAGVAAGDDSAEALSELFNIMPNLKHLNVTWYKLRHHHRTDGDRRDEAFFDQALQRLYKLDLDSCCLRGVTMAGSDLLDLLQTSRPSRVTLQDVHLRTGIWRPIIHHLFGSDSTCDYVHLDDVYQEKTMIHFLVKGKSKFPRMGGSIGPSEIVREGEEVKRTVAFKLAGGRPLGSGAYNMWLHRLTWMFGPFLDHY